MTAAASPFPAAKRRALPSVLVIDDDRDFLAHIASALADFCRHVGVADTPLAAMWALEHDGADIVVCDLVLGSTDGRHLLAEIREQWPAIARILITGHGERLLGGELLSAAQSVVQKPCDTWELVGLFDELTAIAFDGSRPPEQTRAHARRRLPLQAHVVAGGKLRSVTVSNLSLGGACLHLKVAVHPRERLRVVFRVPTLDEPLEVQAVVRWSDGEHVGVQLEGIRAREASALVRLFAAFGTRTCGG